MTHVICIGALIVLIFAMQVSYSYVVDNIQAEIARRELKEIADSISDTLANLYFLTNSTVEDVTLEKNLNLPSDVKGLNYVIEIVFDANKFAQQVYTYIKSKSGISAVSWLLPGLKVDESKYQRIERGEESIVVGCSRVSMSIYVWIKPA